MGVPVVEAPCEAEATCAALAKAGKVYGTATEDMDALTLGTPILIRHLTFSEARKIPIKEISLSRVLDGLRLTEDQFIDMCILLGCDYCESIKGIGPKKSFELIQKYKSIEEILKHLDTKKYTIPENFPYDAVRYLFKNPEVADPSTVEFKWADPDEEGLKKFLVDEKGFNEKRVADSIEKLKKSKTTTVQSRLTTFFGNPTTIKNASETITMEKEARKQRVTRRGRANREHLQNLDQRAKERNKNVVPNFVNTAHNYVDLYY